jgi:hypothetical protein
MKTHFALAGLLLGISSIVSVGLADDRSGSRGGGGFSQPSAPGGSGSFRSAPAPRTESNFSRPSSPMTEHFQRTAPIEEHRAPVYTGNATVLPSVNAPVHVHPGNEFHSNAQPTQPSTRAEQRDDFLGMHDEEPGKRAFVPNHFSPQPGPSTVNRSAIGSPGGGLSEAARHAMISNPARQAERLARPPLPDRWRVATDQYASRLNHWSQTNSASLAGFQATRLGRWNQIEQHRTRTAWRGQFHTAPYRQWRQGVWDYRRQRAEEIWDRTQNLYENLFDNHWWSTCWWRHRPWVVGANISPWWWWDPCSWAEESAFLGPDLGAAPITYDPGTNVFYDDDGYNVDGQDDGSAADARAQAIALASPQVDDVPVPEPAPEGQPAQWLPLGAWALTQQEQGDATLFFQISVDRDGIVAGGYKNALTGDEQPIVGQVDKRQQRIAWHIANAPQTVFETGLSSLDYDVASVFVHFNGTQTQTWLLVRLPSPEMPPGPVKIPNESN